MPHDNADSPGPPALSLDDLPPEMVREVLSFASGGSMLAARRACAGWRNAVTVPMGDVARRRWGGPLRGPLPPEGSGRRWLGSAPTDGLEAARATAAADAAVAALAAAAAAASKPQVGRTSRRSPPRAPVVADCRSDPWSPGAVVVAEYDGGVAYVTPACRTSAALPSTATWCAATARSVFVGNSRSAHVLRRAAPGGAPAADSLRSFAPFDFIERGADGSNQDVVSAATELRDAPEVKIVAVAAVAGPPGEDGNNGDVAMLLDGLGRRWAVVVDEVTLEAVAVVLIGVRGARGSGGACRAVGLAALRGPGPAGLRVVFAESPCQLAVWAPHAEKKLGAVTCDARGTELNHGRKRGSLAWVRSDEPIPPPAAVCLATAGDRLVAVASGVGPSVRFYDAALLCFVGESSVGESFHSLAWPSGSVVALEGSRAAVVSVHRSGAVVVHGTAGLAPLYISGRETGVSHFRFAGSAACAVVTARRQSARSVGDVRSRGDVLTVWAG